MREGVVDLDAIFREKLRTLADEHTTNVISKLYRYYFVSQAANHCPRTYAICRNIYWIQLKENSCPDIVDTRHSPVIPPTEFPAGVMRFTNLITP